MGLQPVTDGNKVIALQTDQHISYSAPVIATIIKSDHNARGLKP
jgi:hypothetical protein